MQKSNVPILSNHADHAARVSIFNSVQNEGQHVRHAPYLRDLRFESSTQSFRSITWAGHRSAPRAITDIVAIDSNYLYFKRNDERALSLAPVIWIVNMIQKRQKR